MKRTLMTVLISGMMAPAAVLAQTANQPAQPQAQPNAAATKGNAAQSVNAADFVTQATSSSHFEIQSSQLALDRSKNEQIRRFAERMVKDHTDANNQMRAAAQGQKMAGDATQQHKQMLEELQKAEGDQFDVRYLQMQQQAHQQAIALHERFVKSGDGEQQLKQHAQQMLPILREHLEQVQQIGKQVAPDQMAQGQQTEQTEASKIVVERDAPRIQVEQASPRIIVHQAQPEVSVQQSQPELIVHQPQPTITVDIPQPQITVRMPEPDVQVSLPRPEIQVEQPQPQVHVQESAQPEVQVEGAQPVASVRGAEGQQPKINYQQADGQPTIRYERDDPKIVVNKAEGQPDVRIERVPRDQQGERGQQAQQRQQEQTSQQGQTAQRQQLADGNVQTLRKPNAGGGQQSNDQERDRIRERFGMNDQAVKGPDRNTAKTQEITVGDIENMDVYNANGEKLGEVGQVVQDANNRQFVVITEGGFFGIGEDRAALPLERFWVQEDRLVAHGVTDQDISAMGDFRNESDQYQEVDNDVKASVGVWQ